MTLNSIFQFLIPKDKKFFPLFEEASSNLVEIASVLHEVVNLPLNERDILFLKIDELEQKIEDIKKYDVQVFGIGDDWRGKFDYLGDYCEVVYLERTFGISSSSIKTLTSALTQDRLLDMRNAVDAISGILKSFGN